MAWMRSSVRTRVSPPIFRRSPSARAVGLFLFWILPFSAATAADLEELLDKAGDPIADDHRAQILGYQGNGVVRIETGSGRSRTIATGTFVGPTGWVLTNDHVIAGLEGAEARRTVFRTRDGRETQGFERIRCWAGRYPDLCLIKIELRPKYWFLLAQDTPEAGTTLYMIGNTFTTAFDLRAGPSMGHKIEILEGLRRLEVGAPVRPGFSGGPIFTEAGKLVCIASNRLVGIQAIGNKRVYDKGSLRHFCIPREMIAEFMRW